MFYNYNNHCINIYFISSYNCDWISENWPNCHTRPIPLFFLAQLMATLVRTLHIHSGITRLGWLVCFSRASFADPVNSQLRQWDPWRVLHGRHGSEIHPSDREMSLTPFNHAWTLWLALLGLIASPNSSNGRFNPPLVSHSPLHPPLPLPPPITCHQWYYSGFEKSCSKSSSVS